VYLFVPVSRGTGPECESGTSLNFLAPTTTSFLVHISATMCYTSGRVTWQHLGLGLGWSPTRYLSARIDGADPLPQIYTSCHQPWREISGP
jgi:hypothetical protein